MTPYSSSSNKQILSNYWVVIVTQVTRWYLNWMWKRIKQFLLQVLSKLKDATTRGHFGDDLDTLGNPAVVKNHIETLKDQVSLIVLLRN